MKGSCNYCTNMTSILCTACQKHFCNSKGKAKASHIIFHLVKHHHKRIEFQDKAVSCDCGDTVIFNLGHTDKGEIVCRTCCSSAAWQPVVVEKALQPALFEAEAFSTLTQTDLVKIECEGPPLRLATQLSYTLDAYRNVFSTLIEAECATERAVKESLMQENVPVRFDTSVDLTDTEQRAADYLSAIGLQSPGAKCAGPRAERRIFCYFVLKDADNRVSIGDELLITRGPLRCKAYITASSCTTEEMRARVYRVTGGTPVTGNYTIEYVYKSIGRNRMLTALKRLTKMSESLLAHILGTDHSEERRQELIAFFHSSQALYDSTTILNPPRMPLLNASQQGAVKAALSNQLTLIQGPPGTGKTLTCAAVVYNLVHKKKQRVLVVSSSNTAVDHLTLKLHQTGLRVVRIVSKRRENANDELSFLSLHVQAKILLNEERRRKKEAQDKKASKQGYFDAKVNYTPRDVNHQIPDQSNHKKDSSSKHPTSETLKKEQNPKRSSKNGLHSFSDQKECGLAFSKASKPNERKSKKHTNIQEKNNNLSEIAGKFGDSLSDSEDSSTVSSEVLVTDPKKERQKQLFQALKMENNKCSDENLHDSDYEQRKFSISRKILDHAEVVACTCITAGQKVLSGLEFPFVLIDEAVQCTEPLSLIPLVYNCRKLILVGDHKQLGPIILDKRASKAGLKETMFERLIKLGNVPFLLNTQYRMHPRLAEWPSNQFYDGSLKSGVSEAKRSTRIPLPLPTFFWVCYGTEELSGSGTSFLNQGEAILVENTIKLLMKNGIKEEQIGVITPYQGQRAHLNQRLAKTKLNLSLLEIKNVDAFQGREKDFIIVSLVRSNLNQGIGFLSDKRRLNVTLTRAKYGCIIIGNPTTLAKESIWHDFIRFYQDRDMVFRGSLECLESIQVVKKTQGVDLRALFDKIQL